MLFPFEVPFEQIKDNLDTYVDEVCGALKSEFLAMPKGKGFIEYPVFEQGYESLKRVTNDFHDIAPEQITDIIYQMPIVFIVIRSILGFTPSEWAYVASQRTTIEVPQGAARTLDRGIRMNPLKPLRAGGTVTEIRLRALITTACQLLLEGAPNDTPGLLHRLSKADTRFGLRSLQPLSNMGVPYAMMLYERFLGRPFAGHRDSVSELVGDVLETAIETILTSAGIGYRKTKRAERLEGFDQAPDFIVPDEFNPQVIIEAKITEDDGTARDKITRIQHLSSLSMSGRGIKEPPRFEVVACIAGRGFKVRREDMKKLLLATRGKVFTMMNLDRLIDCTRLTEFKTRKGCKANPAE